jgi:tetratricopeptide (TPR) repeat protein
MKLHGSIKFSAWSGLGRGDEALAGCERALDLVPDGAKLWNLKAYLLLKREAHETYEDALEACEHALRLDARLDVVWNNKAITLSRLQRHEEALTAIDEALRLSPRSPNAWVTKAEALAALKRTEEAHAAAEQSLAVLDEEWSRRAQTAAKWVDGWTESDEWQVRAGALRLLGREAEAAEAETRVQELRA